MPGIFGVVDASGGQSERRTAELLEIVEQMAAAMQYDSAYVTDILSCPELGACAGRVGWPDGADPAPTGRTTANLVLVTAGEPIPDTSFDPARSIDNQAEAKGLGARDLVQLYSRLGEEALPRVDGAFAGFLVDRRRATCLLFNDRYGMERLFLHRSGDRTLFSSEAKAILAVAPRTRTFDPQGLAQLLTCGCTLGERSLFRDIEVLEGGSVIRFRSREGSSRRAYFDRAALEQAGSLPASRSVDALTESLRAAVNDAARRPPRVGISLTGGLDSRMVMAHLDAAAGTIPCYTFGSLYRETFDVAVGREVARRCSQPHRVIELGSQFLGDFRTLLEEAVLVSDGYLGFAGAAELYLNRIARSIAPVRITGNWGGEVLRGVRAFKWTQPQGAFLGPQLQQQLTEAADTFTAESVSNPLSYTLFHHLPALGYGRYAIERSQVLMRTPFLDGRVIECLYQTPVSTRTSSDCSSDVIKKGRADLLTIPTDQGLLGTGPGAVRFARHLYRRVLAKGEYLTSHGAPAWVVRPTASAPGSLLEQAFRGRHKFHHFRQWIRGPFAALVRETLTHDPDETLCSWFDLPKVRLMVQEHLEGRANYTNEIDALMTVAIAGRSLLKPARVEPVPRPPAHRPFVHQD